MKNPIDGYGPKFCPVCLAKCEKYVMFQTSWYWRCPTCKIDADNPPADKIKPKSSHIPLDTFNVWDDDVTHPNFKMINHHELLADDFTIVNNMITKDAHGNAIAEIRIAGIGKKNGIHTSYDFNEKFQPSAHNTGLEDEMWEDIAIRVLRLSFAINIHDVKIEYLKDRMASKFPGDKVTVS